MENTPGIEHIDMWHEQVSFLDEEHPFSSPAVFIEFIRWVLRMKGYSFSGFTRRLISGCFTKLFPIPTKVRQCRKRRCPFLTCCIAGDDVTRKIGKNFGTLRRTHVGGKSRGVRETCTGSALNVNHGLHHNGTCKPCRHERP